MNKEDRIINNDDELIDLIYVTYEELKRLDKKAELKHAFNQLDIWENEDIQPMQIMDKRTMDIISTYQFYQNSPEKAFNPIPNIWFESVIILNRLKPRLF